MNNFTKAEKERINSKFVFTLAKLGVVLGLATEKQKRERNVDVNKVLMLTFSEGADIITHLNRIIRHGR